MWLTEIKRLPKVSQRTKAELARFSATIQPFSTFKAWFKNAFSSAQSSGQDTKTARGSHPSAASHDPLGHSSAPCASGEGRDGDPARPVWVPNNGSQLLVSAAGTPSPALSPLGGLQSRPGHFEGSLRARHCARGPGRPRPPPQPKTNGGGVRVGVMPSHPPPHGQAGIPALAAPRSVVLLSRCPATTPAPIP